MDVTTPTANIRRRPISTLGGMARASMFAGVLPVTMGIVYAIWPTEHRLMLMRPLSLATVFSAVTGLAMGVINEAHRWCRCSPASAA
jgi:hypothetical protein